MSAPTVVAYRITVPTTAEDDVATALWEAGSLGFEIEDAVQDRLGLVAYFAERPGLPHDLVLSLASLDLTIEPTPVPTVDWVARFRDGFRPFSIGRFQIVPAWDSPSVPHHPFRLLIEPGQAFGTGTHESTRLCLRALEELAQRDALGRTIDLGAGTGLLALAAFRLGASLAVASDLDPAAMAAVRHHATLNQVPLRMVRGDGGLPFASRAFDLVLANLTRPLLVERRFELAALLRPRGRMILSGFLLEDLPAIRAAYSTRPEDAILTDGDWVALVTGRAETG